MTFEIICTLGFIALFALLSGVLRGLVAKRRSGMTEAERVADEAELNKHLNEW